MLKLKFCQNILRNSEKILLNYGRTQTIYSSSPRGSKFVSSVDIPEESIRTMAEVKANIMKSLGLDFGYSPVPKSREHLLQYQPKLEDLPPRAMSDSFTSALIPLGSNLSLQNKYVNVLGRIRVGRLMEDMDLFAVWVCHKHLHIEKFDPKVPLPYTFVTVFVDKIDLTEIVPVCNEDIRLVGHTSWVGRSSMEVTVWLEQKRDNKWKKITRALFLMAARNATNTKAAPVNPLEPGNSEEEKILADAHARMLRRQRLRQESLLKMEPTNHEQHLIHEIFIETLKEDNLALNTYKLPPGAKWIEDTRLSTTIFPHPENRNAHDKVFGGFLMRLALETSFMSVFMFCKRRPKVEHICDISFQKPVDVSSFIKMTAYVVYTNMNYVQVITVADIFDPGRETAHTSNEFHYTFISPEIVPRVLPKTYHEAMWHIEGRRKLNHSLGL